MIEAVIASPVRTPIGKFGGALTAVAATDLGATAIKGAIARAGLAPETIELAVMGNVVQAGNRMNPARQATVKGGLGVSTPASTVNRVCGSGLEAVATAANSVWLGQARAAIAGGMENMDRAPYLLPGARSGMRLGNSEVVDSMLLDGLHDAFSGKHSGWHTEEVIAQFGLSREDQDGWAVRSQHRFARAAALRFFQREIVPVELSGKSASVLFKEDEAPRPDTSLEALARLRPAFKEDGSITAGNAPGLNSGAAAMIVGERQFLEGSGVEPVARIQAHAVTAIDPARFALAPVSAISKVLEIARWPLSEVERFEINEAYAAVPLLVAKQLGLPLDLVNVEGGAVAHGHPIGATGAILLTRLVHSMRRDGLSKGIVSLCIGGGQGIAVAVEILN